MVAARSHAAGETGRAGKTSVARLRAAAERVLACHLAELPDALADLRAALAHEKNATAGYTPEPFDWYVEERWSVDLLFGAEQFVGTICDPACGQGTIIQAALDVGYDAYGSDLIDRPKVAEFRFEKLDFFSAGWDPRPGVPKADNIVCNPPFSYEKGIAERFIRRALQVARRKVAMLLPVKFNSSNGRYALFTGTPLARIYTLSSRPSMPPGSMLQAGTIKAGGGKVDYCWMVWERGFEGPPTNHYLIRPDKLEAQRRRARPSTAGPHGAPSQSATTA